MRGARAVEPPGWKCAGCPPVDRALLVRRRALAPVARPPAAGAAAVGRRADRRSPAGYQVLKASSVFAVRQVTVQAVPGRRWTARCGALRPPRSRSQPAAGQHRRQSSARSQRSRTCGGDASTGHFRTPLHHRRMEQPVGWPQSGGGALPGRRRRPGAGARRPQTPDALPQIALPAQTALRVGSTTAIQRDGRPAVLRSRRPVQPSVGPITHVVAAAGTVTAVVGQRVQIRLGTPTQLALKLRVAEPCSAGCPRPAGGARLHRRLGAAPAPAGAGLDTVTNP